MAQNYTRQSSFNDGDTITASLFNDEYNQLVNAFTYSSTSESTTGHRHDGSANQGGNIFKIGDLDFLNKIEVDSTNNRWGFYVEVSSAAVEQIRIQDGSVVPVTTNDIDLGTASLQFKDLYIDGTANVDSLTLTSGATVTTILDEDDMSSDSDTALVTQQSVKAYVDAQVTAQDFDFQADTGGALSIDLDSETMTFTGGTGIDTSGALNEVTFAIDSTVTTLTGTQTLTNKTLTSPDIDGGTIDGTVIGGTTPAAVSATTVSATGNITVGGTVDGRDVAADGTKLDGIEASADVTDTANVTAAGALMDSELTSEASVKALNQGVATTDSPTFAGVTVSGDANFDSGTLFVDVSADKVGVGTTSPSATLHAYHATDDTVLKVESGDGQSRIDLIDSGGTARVNSVGSDLRLEADPGNSVANSAIDFKVDGTQVMRIDDSFNVGIGTTSPSAKLDVAGTVEFDGLSGTGSVTVTDILDQDDMSSDSATALATQQSIKAYVDSQVGTVDTLAEVLANGNTTGGTDIAVSSGDDITFADNSKAIFGAGSDLEIYHDGSNSYVADTGTGGLYLKGSSEIALRSSTNENIFLGLTDGAAYVYHNGSAKLATTSTGIDVTGTVTADGLTVGDNEFFLAGAGGDFKIGHDGTDNIIRSQGPSLYIDANNHIFRGYSPYTEHMRIDSSGNVGIGTSSPDRLLHLNTGTTGAITPLLRLEGQFTSNTGNEGTAIEFITGSGGTEVGARIIATREAAGARGALRFCTGRENDAGFDDGNLVIDESGRVGIGTQSPAKKLSVKADGGGSQLGIDIHNEGTATGDDAVISFETQGSREFTIGLDRSATSFVIAESSTLGSNQRLVIDDSGNVGIGTTPSHPLHLVAADGTLALFSNGADADLNIKTASAVTLLTPSTGTLAFGTSNTERMRIDSSGNVGIGTSSPSGPLNIHSASGDTNLYVTTGNTAASTNIFFGDTDNSTIGRIVYDHNGDYMKFRTNGSDAMRIDSSGNLLVGKSGTALGTAGVEINQGGTAGKVWMTRSGDNPLLINRLSNDGSLVDFYKDGSTVGNIGVDSGDNLYIGGSVADHGGLYFGTRVAAPINAGTLTDDVMDLGTAGYRFKDLYLSGTANSSGLSVRNAGALVGLVENTSNTSDARMRVKNTLSHFEMGHDNAGGYLQENGAYPIRFFTNAGERMRLDASGNLLVGQTSESESFVNVKVVDGGQAGITTTTLTGSSASTAIRFRNGNGVVGSIVTSGSATAYNTSSDQRLKENIVDAPSASDDIDAIQVRSFDWKADGSHQKYGMVAQELQNVAPEAVSGDADSDDMMGVDYSKLVPMLVKEIQSLRARVAQLETN